MDTFLSINPGVGKERKDSGEISPVKQRILFFHIKPKSFLLLNMVFAPLWTEPCVLSNITWKVEKKVDNEESNSGGRKDWKTNLNAF